MTRSAPRRTEKPRETTASKYRLWTFDDFCAVIPGGQKADLIEGVIYVASPDNLEHHDIYVFLNRVLLDFMDEKGVGGRVYGSRVAFRLDDENAPEPDLAFVASDEAHRFQKAHVKGAPDWVVEIVSPDSVERDYQRKRDQYEKFGVQEYWIIDPLESRMTCFRRGKDGRFKESRPRGDKVASRVIAGFWVRPSWFWQSPLPAKKQILQEILAAGDKS